MHVWQPLLQNAVNRKVAASAEALKAGAETAVLALGDELTQRMTFKCENDRSAKECQPHIFITFRFISLTTPDAGIVAEAHHIPDATAIDAKSQFIPYKYLGDTWVKVLSALESLRGVSFAEPELF